MLVSRFLYLVPVGMISACVSQPVSLKNSSIATAIPSATALKAPLEAPKSSETSNDGAPDSGRDPAPMHGLLGEWLIENVDQRGVMDNVHLTLTFSSEGRVSGQLGCNAVSGRFTADKAGLAFGPLVSTRKMCGSTALMNQEGLVLRSLQTLNAVTWSDNGAAILSGPEGHSIIMRRVAPIAAPGMAHGDISPTPVMYQCETEAFGIAFEAQAAYLTEANGALIVLSKIDDGAGDDTRETFSNGRVTVFRQGGAGGNVHFARGRMAPLECRRATG